MWRGPWRAARSPIRMRALPSPSPELPDPTAGPARSRWNRLLRRRKTGLAHAQRKRVVRRSRQDGNQAVERRARARSPAIVVVKRVRPRCAHRRRRPSPRIALVIAFHGLGEEPSDKPLEQARAEGVSDIELDVASAAAVRLKMPAIFQERERPIEILDERSRGAVEMHLGGKAFPDQRATRWAERVASASRP